MLLFAAPGPHHGEGPPSVSCDWLRRAPTLAALARCMLACALALQRNNPRTVETMDLSPHSPAASGEVEFFLSRWEGGRMCAKVSGPEENIYHFTVSLGGYTAPGH